MVVEEDEPIVLYCLPEISQNTLVYRQRISNLLRKEMADEEKAKAANESANMKKKYEANKKPWVEEKETLEGKRNQNEKRLKTWKDRCLDSEKKLEKEQRLKEGE